MRMRTNNSAKISKITSDGGKISLSFSVYCDKTIPGESVGIVGECEELGRWKNVVQMKADKVVYLLCVVLPVASLLPGPNIYYVSSD